MPFLTARRLLATFALLALSTAVLAAPANTVAPSIKRSSSHVSTRSTLDITELVPRSDSSSGSPDYRESRVAQACRELDMVACSTLVVIIEPVCPPEDIICLITSVLIDLNVTITPALLAELELLLTANVTVQLQAILAALGELTLADLAAMLNLTLAELKAKIQVLLGSSGGLSVIIDLLLDL